MRWDIASFLAAAALTQEASAKWGQPPQDWGDFRFALVDDNTQQKVIEAGIKDGARIYGRYRYLNAGVDSATNWYSYVGPHGAAVLQFEKSSEDLGIKGSYVIYMLQEDGGYEAFARNVKDPAFMKSFFWNLEWLAKTLTSRSPVFIIEPDTWGYLLQYEQARLGVQSTAEYGKATAALTARVGDIGYPHLSGLPNTITGVLQGIIKTFRTFAPDARIGFHLNTWAWIPPTGGDARGMVYWTQNLVDASADINAAFLNNLFGSPATQDKGDFLVVEKYGLDAGYIRSSDGSAMGARYFWNDESMAKWVGWSKRLGKAVDMPLLGWQIPIGHMGLPNTANRWQDTFMEYFFAHPADFMAAGFIGMWVGKGLPQGTDYANAPGKGDDGALFSKLREFDRNRPYLGSTSIGRYPVAAPVAALKPTLTRRGPGGMEYRRGNGYRAFTGEDPAPWHTAGGRRSTHRQGIAQ